eukprot:gnl/TRDRNA2_/TRDRNA2_161578_c0_seq6.p1 gnl/TRDRNA2_/TRDRNA2_161578_c0~~gnl/TRDRNA2_/TRDRNA2_161578_c0_seq6.p1  ORF type:complete len:563 (+),score=122.04 gnl/TRDRNA2_/TRDRNA2_161578_c0_seq6:74-1762(+)
MLPLFHVLLAAIWAARAQLPPASQFSGWGGVPPPPVGALGAAGPAARPGAGQAALQDAVEGIAGLMQRFEQLQPQLGRIPQGDLEGIVNEGQQLHVRFMELQEQMRAAAGGVIGGATGDSVVTFHRDLAHFVERVESQLGITGPMPPSSFGSAAGIGGISPPVRPLGAAGAFGSQAPAAPAPSQDSGGSWFGSGRSQAATGAGGTATGGGSVTPATDQRLATVMNGIVQGMQRFEALHPKLQQVPRQIFEAIANEGQRLHESFTVLQQRGVALAGDGSKKMSEVDAVEYAEQMEAFVAAQTAFVQRAEAQLQQGPSTGSGQLGGGYSGMLGSPLSPVPPSQRGAASSGQGASAFSSSGFGRAPPCGGLGGALPGATAGLGGAAAGLGGALPGAAAGTVTPATDQRLSSVIKRVVEVMNEFEAMKPSINRLAPQQLQFVAERGQQLHERFVSLQQRGSSIAGDGSRPMRESDALSYATDMEAFHQDQVGFVEQTKQALQGADGGAAVAGGGLGSAGGLGTGGRAAGGLPPATGFPGSGATAAASGFGGGIESSGSRETGPRDR